VTLVAEKGAMIAAMDPVLDPETYAFVTVTEGYRSRRIGELALATFNEAEGVSFILTLESAKAFYLPEGVLQRRIVLQVGSALDGIGLTAAVAGALAEAGIACNCVAAFHHDHIFVPAGDADAALERLLALQASARAG